MTDEQIQELYKQTLEKYIELIQRGIGPHNVMEYLNLQARLAAYRKILSGDD